MDDVVARAQRIDVLFNALGMDDVQGTLLVDMSAEDFAQPVIKATRTSSSPCARRRGGWSGKGPGWSCPSPWLPRPCPTTGFGVACGAVRAVAEFRRGARTTRDPARHPAVGRVSGEVLGRGEQRNLASASSDAVRGSRHDGVGSCQRDDRGHGQRHVRVLGRRVSLALTTDAARQPRERAGGSGHG